MLDLVNNFSRPKQSERTEKTLPEYYYSILTAQVCFQRTESACNRLEVPTRQAVSSNSWHDIMRSQLQKTKRQFIPGETHPIYVVRPPGRALQSKMFPMGHPRPPLTSSSIEVLRVLGSLDNAGNVHKNREI